MFKISCDQGSFLESINAVSKAVSTAATMPALKGILVEADGMQIRLSANNLETGVETTVPGMALEAGEVLIDGKMLQETIKSLPSGDLTMTAEICAVVVTCGKATFRIPQMKAEEYTRMENMTGEKAVSFNMKRADYRDMVSGTLFALDNTSDNKLMSGVHIEVDPAGKAVFTAIDGHRIAVLRRECEAAGAVDCIVPGKSMNEVARLAGGSGDIRITVDEHRILFEYDDVKYTSRLIDGKYYAVDQMLQTATPTKVVLDKVQFAGCVNRGNIVAGREKKPVIFQSNGTEMTVSAKSSLGDMCEVIDIAKEGSGDFRIGFNPKFLIDPMKTIEDDKITLLVGNPKSPAKIVSEDDSYTYLILPVNIGNA